MALGTAVDAIKRAEAEIRLPGNIRGSFQGTAQAFRARLWLVGLSNALGEREPSATTAVVLTSASEVRLCALGRLESPVRGHSVVVEAAGSRWRLPADELLVTLMATRVGDPRSAPSPPFWPHLALALLAWARRIRIERVLELAAELDVAPAVHHGLAVVCAVFPELRELIHPERLTIPWWEKRLALPVATRHLIKDALDAEGWRPAPATVSS